jgi:hypothetical protein
MRLRQRVGRLNRYGQTRQVEVITLGNPETVESRIWDKLNAKIENIMAALGRAMDEPEDLMRLVLGMASPSLFRELLGPQLRGALRQHRRSGRQRPSQQGVPTEYDARISARMSKVVPSPEVWHRDDFPCL